MLFCCVAPRCTASWLVMPVFISFASLSFHPYRLSSLVGHQWRSSLRETPYHSLCSLRSLPYPQPRAPQFAPFFRSTPCCIIVTIPIPSQRPARLPSSHSYACF
ncbi:hypothetical protein C2E23DRAFT_812457 [Lenzites betulinus]|nr:hypothetical protein C2E23DRAFT_812457 [Lenzites betulinus]